MDSLTTLVHSLIGNAPLNYVIDATGNYIKIYDTEYLLKAFLLIITLNFVYKLLLQLVRNLGRSDI